ncbi:MAG: FtsX-like permease family protein, partial [Clostridia bacterium]|nr:FtsX-like permease family protein [Clostridia bacterium]
MLFTVCGILIFVIMFTSVFCIRNSFAISITEKTKMYGMLSSVGATKKQIKKSVISEAMILGIIGVPIGSISGIFAIFVLLKIVGAILGEFLFDGIEGILLGVNALSIILSAVLGFITIYLSAFVSARRASKVSPMSLIRNSGDIKIKAKKLKTPKIIEKLFKTGGVLAYKNLKRSKKKYRTTVISITVSIFIFITMSTFVNNMFDFSGKYYQNPDYNVKVYFAKENLEQVLALDDIEEYFLLYETKEHSYLKIYDLDKVKLQELLGLEEDENGEYKKANYIGMQIIGLDDATFKKYTKKIDVSYEKVKKSGILTDTVGYFEDNKEVSSRMYTYEVGDIISGKYLESDINIKVGAVTDIRPYGIENYYYHGGYLIVDMESFKDIEFELQYISINSKNPNNLEENIEKISTDIRVTNIEEQVKQERAMGIVVKIFLYGFLGVITLIVVTNIFNTITSNMELRQKEFAMLKSIGMT